MKNFIAIVAVLSVAGFAHAQSTTTPKLRPGMIKRENVRDAREDIRNERKEEVKDIRENMREKLASTSPRNMMGSTTRKEIREEKKEIRQTARKDEAVAKKDALVKQLELTLNNLTKAKTSISSIIEKRVAEGKSVGNAQALLTTAATKIEAAKKAVASIEAWKPDTKTASSTEISLTKPRQNADAAIKAVKEARQAIDAVIKEVRSQGKKGNESATSTNQ